MKRYENVGVGTELAKRTYLEGAVITKQCDCGSEMEIDWGSDYLSYPVVGEYDSFSMYCDNCDTEHEEAVKIKIEINLVVEESWWLGVLLKVT